jgi:hypothetical protein
MLAAAVYLGLALTAALAPESRSDPGLDKATREKIRQLTVRRCNALKKALALRIGEYREGFDGRGATHDELARVSRMLLKAELDLATKPAERVTAHALHLEMMKLVEKIAAAEVEKIAPAEPGSDEKADVVLARAARLDAEAGWLAAGGKNSGAEMVDKGIRNSGADRELIRAVGDLAEHLGRRPKDRGGKDRDD